LGKCEGSGMVDIDLRLGDCLDVMAGMEPDSVDTIITDPPYGLSVWRTAPARDSP